MQSLKMTVAKGLIASVATIALTLALSLQPQAERPSVAVSDPAPKPAAPNRQPVAPVLANNYPRCRAGEACNAGAAACNASGTVAR